MRKKLLVISVALLSLNGYVLSSTKGQIGNNGLSSQEHLLLPAHSVKMNSIKKNQLPVLLRTDDEKEIRQASKLTEKGISRVSDNTVTERKQLDSIVAKNSAGVYQSKTVYNYNEAGKRTLRAIYSWNSSSSSWIGSSKEETIYSVDQENNACFIRTTYSWDYQNNTWMNSSKEESVLQGATNYYKYRTTYTWDRSTEMWITVSKLEQLNNTEGFDQLFVEYTWNPEINGWNGIRRAGYKYDQTSSYVVYYTKFGWDASNQFWNTNKTKFYNPEGSVTGDESYKRNNANDAWTGTEKQDYSYINDEKTIKVITYYNWYQGQWVKSTKQETTNDLTYDVFYSWNSTTNQWVGDFKKECSYDSVGNRTSLVRYLWDATNNDWVLKQKYTYEFDNVTGSWQIYSKSEFDFNEMGQETSFVQMYRPNSSQPWISSYTYKRITTYDNYSTSVVYYKWDASILDWIINYKNEIENNQDGTTNRITMSEWNGTTYTIFQISTYFYSTVSSGVSAPSLQIRLNSYPNPVQNNLIVTGTTMGKTIKITDIAGKIVGTFPTQNEQTIVPASSLKHGVYIVDVDGVSMKMIKD